MEIQHQQENKKCAECGTQPIAYIVLGGKFFCQRCITKALEAFSQIQAPAVKQENHFTIPQTGRLR